MNIRLSNYIQVGGSQVKSVEAARVDFDKRVVWLDDGRWIPFENVSIGSSDLLPRAEGVEYLRAFAPDMTPPPVITAEVCVGCGKPFDTEKAVKAHKRFCKGAT